MGEEREKVAAADARAGENAYWRQNLRYVFALLTVWFAVSYGAGIVFVDELNSVRLPGTGFKLGFWFAQQGSIVVFVVLIFVYVTLMKRLDSKLMADRRAEAKRGDR